MLCNAGFGTLLIFLAVYWLDHWCQFKNKLGLLCSEIAVFPLMFNLKFLSILFRAGIAMTVFIPIFVFFM